jgi:uncharacterized delta-60 repeat protein
MTASKRFCEPLEPRRLFSAGELEPAFGTGGVASFDFDGNERAFGIAAAPNDTFLVFGRSDSPDTPVPVFRIHGNGTLDTSFGDDGRLITTDFPWAFNPQTGRARFAVDSSTGRFAMSMYDGAARQAVLLVFTPAGQLDTAFDGDGLMRFDTGIGPDVALAFQPDGKLIHVSVSSTEEGLFETFARRFNTDGSLDTTFGDGGVAVVAQDVLSENDEFWVEVAVPPMDVGLAPDGKITVLGIEHAANQSVNLYRLNADGTPDDTFGGGTHVRQIHQRGESARDLDIGPNGATVVIGQEWQAMFGSAILRRYDANGIETGNRAFKELPGGAHTKHVVVRAEADAAGGVITYEYELAADGTSQTYLARYYSDLTPDTTWGVNGRMPVNFFADGLIALPDGSAIVAGGGGGSGNKDYRLARVQGGLAAQPTEITARVNGRGSLIVNAPGTIDRTIDLTLRESDGMLIVSAGDDFERAFDPDDIRKIAVFTAGGSDVITIGPGVMGTYVDAGSNGDTVNGGEGADIVLGGAGIDRIFGGDGNDTLLGGGGRDFIAGGAGNDVIDGGHGDDHLRGNGGNDRLFGGTSPYDFGEHDRLYGGAGHDAAPDDDNDAGGNDARDSIEELLS